MAFKEGLMNRDVLETQWTQIREILHDKFSNLTDEDIRQINGRYDELVAKLQQKYGYSREEAEERVRSWNFDRMQAPRSQMMREDKKVRREEDSSSIFKWLLAIGIPLILLGLYFFNPMSRTQDVTTAPTATQQQVVTETPADRTISTGIRSALQSQQNTTFDLQNVQIRTNNGVVTLSGSVPSAEMRDSIGTTAQNFAGVRQVNNNLLVK